MARSSSKSSTKNAQPTAEIARKALHNLTEAGMPPTPENYAKAYYQSSGQLPPDDKMSRPCMNMLDIFRLLLDDLAAKTGGLASDLDDGKKKIKQSVDSLKDTTEKDRILDLLASVVAVTTTIHNQMEDTHEDILASRLTMEHIKSEMQETRQWLQEDTLTGAQNRRGMDIALTREVARAKRNNNKLSVAMIDIDYFKRVNDQYGHDAGDMLLAHLGTVIRSVLRESDVLVRYGGEEFLIILPESDVSGAQFVLERLQVVVRKSPLNYENKKIDVTFSAGIAQLKSDENGHALIIRADKALYEAKLAGRNLIKFAD